MITVMKMTMKLVLVIMVHVPLISGCEDWQKLT